jgi:hypothetical protein
MIDLDVLESELKEKTEDLRVFTEARTLIRQRVLELRDSQSGLTPLTEWSGTDAVLGSLDLAIHAMERTIRELQQLFEASQKGRKFRVIHGDES